ncbi:MAG TPA: alkaline phosphatase family protein, partial [Flavobacteriaceae bacterium]|nr:alkaline phosphatase family protein [Flavobacteriaceae bacterium]
ADAAYWFHGKQEGRWISSSYYMEELPKWVIDFNASKAVKSYMNLTWETLYPIETYTESYDDDNPFEKKFAGKETPTFPYNLNELAPENGYFDLLKETPFGNNITTDFAIAAIEGEALGKDKITDFLAISYSSPDYIGHSFGVHSKEVQDNYLRLDKDIERLLNYLDNNVGVGQYTVFLTADHGVVHNPGYLMSHKIPAGYMDNNQLQENLKAFAKEHFGNKTCIENVSYGQVFLNKKALKIDAETAQKSIAEFLLQQPFIEKVFTRTQLENNTYQKDIGNLIQNGFNQKRSGDVMYVLQPAVLSTWYKNGGTTHGSGYTYDTHVPLLFFGNGIKKGHTYQKSEITDIAPTLSALLGIARPNGVTGRVLVEMLEY